MYVSLKHFSHSLDATICSVHLVETLGHLYVALRRILSVALREQLAIVAID